MSVTGTVWVLHIQSPRDQQDDGEGRKPSRRHRMGGREGRERGVRGEVGGVRVLYNL